MDKYITYAKGAGKSGQVCHFDGVQSDSYTLCGSSLDVDPDIYERMPSGPITDSSVKVNCPLCKAIVAYARLIKNSEID